MKKKFPNRIRKEGDYLRSAQFSYKDFLFDDGIKTIYILSKKELLKYKKFFDSKFFNILMELVNE